VPKETVLAINWAASLETAAEQPLDSAPDEPRIPFELGERFGYVSLDGRFSVNRRAAAYVSLSDYLWAEFGGTDNSIAVRTPQGGTAFIIEDGHGYPFFLDGRVFIMHSDQNSVSRLDADGNIEWTYDFTAPVTCVDAAAGFLLAGTLAGTAELVDSEGRGVYTAEPSGSRIAGIYGCALSADGTMMALVCGLDSQRFVLMGQSGAASASSPSWRVLAHEFIGEGLRRPVFVRFVDGGGTVAYERDGGLGLYAVKPRTSRFLPLEGRLLAVEDSLPAPSASPPPASETPSAETPVPGILFILTEAAPSSAPASRKTLFAVSMSGELLIEAGFSADTAFLSQRDGLLLVGGGSALAAFSLESK
jgi:hypothetical protein